MATKASTHSSFTLPIRSSRKESGATSLGEEDADDFLSHILTLDHNHGPRAESTIEALPQSQVGFFTGFFTDNQDDEEEELEPDSDVEAEDGSKYALKPQPKVTYRCPLKELGECRRSDTFKNLRSLSLHLA